MDFRSIEAFLDLVKDPAKYESVLGELENRYSQLRVAEEKANVIGNIERLEARVQELQDAAVKTKADAEAQAESILAKARDLAQKMVDEASNAKDEAKQLSADAKDLKRQCTAQLKELGVMKKEVEDRAANVREMELELERNREEVRARLAKLQSVMQG